MYIQLPLHGFLAIYKYHRLLIMYVFASKVLHILMAPTLQDKIMEKLHQMH